MASPVEEAPVEETSVAEADPGPVPPTTLGDPAECPVRGTVVGEFLPAGSKRIMPDRRCPECRSLERHRAVWLCFQARTNLFDEQLRMLHIAPEGALGPRLSALPNLHYLSADLSSPRAMVHMDLTELAAPDGSFDVVYASHVLEHIPDDRQAICEIHRVLRPGVGRCSSSHVRSHHPGGRLGVGPDGA